MSNTNRPYDQTKMNKNFSISLENAEYISRESIRRDVTQAKIIADAINSYKGDRKKEESELLSMTEDIKHIRDHVAKLDARVSWIEGQLTDAELVITKKL